MNSTIRRLILLCLFFAGALMALRYILPLALPFLLGGLLALAAEPLVRFLDRSCRFPRSAASAVGVTGAFALLMLVLMLLLGVFIRQLRQLSGIVPEFMEAARSGMGALLQWILGLVDRLPPSIRPVISRHVRDFFSDGTALLDQSAGLLLNLASGVLSRIPGGALSLGTGIIASYMISAKLPGILLAIQEKLPREKLSRFFTLLSHIKHVFFGWLKAQLKLSSVTFLLMMAGLFLLGISPAPLWAALVALVDAFPILGTGTILIPWSLVSFLQGDHFRAFALLGLYAGAALLRSVLEPRLLGKQLGLDPLVTLIALYTGFRLFGLPGMLLSPMVAVAALRIGRSLRTEDEPPTADAT